MREIKEKVGNIEQFSFSGWGLKLAFFLFLVMLLCTPITICKGATTLSYNIYLHDLITHTNITIAEKVVGVPSFSLYQNTVGWSEKNGMWILNVSSMNKKIIPAVSFGEYPPYKMDIFGNTLVFDCYKYNNDWNVCIYNLTASSVVFITASSHNQILPAIYEKIVVWQDDRNGDWDIFAYDLEQNIEIRITNNSHNQTYPAIWGDIVVWQDDRNGDWDIYLYNLSGKLERQITCNLYHQIRPSIHNTTVVWIERSYILRNEKILEKNAVEIWSHNLINDEQNKVIDTIINITPETVEYVDIWENRVIWWTHLIPFEDGEGWPLLLGILWYIWIAFLSFLFIFFVVGGIVWSLKYWKKDKKELPRTRYIFIILGIIFLLGLVTLLITILMKK